MEPEFLKINPQHCVPTIDDDGFYLWESRAILSYLMETKAPHMLPNSPEERAVINQRLFFELGGLGKKYQELYVREFNFLENTFRLTLNSIATIV